MSFLHISETQMRKAFEARQREELLQKFKENDEPQLRLEHRHVWGGNSYQLHNKESIFFQRGDRLKLIINQNLSRDTNVIWSTLGKSVKEAVRKGGLRPQALTSIAIKSLGQYYLKSTLGRMLKSRILSKLYREKSLLLNVLQDRIEALQPLERHLGQRVEIENPALTANEMSATILKYMESLNLSPADWGQYQQNLAQIQNYHEWTKQRRFNHARLRVMQDCNREAREQAMKLLALIRKNKTNAKWLQTTGNEYIFSFIQDTIIYDSRITQGLNQVLTHQYAWLRGDLNGFIEDTVKAARNYKQDWHTQVTVDHQLAYPDDKPVTIDSDFHTNGSEEELDDLMMIISEVSGDNSILNDLKGPVRKTAATKWRHWRSYYDNSSPYEISIFRNPSRFFGLLRNILLSPLNLIETAIFGNEAKWVATLWYNPPAKDERVEGKTDYYALAYRIKKKTSISTKIGLELYRMTHDLFAEGIVKGLLDGWEQIKRLPRDLEADFHKPSEKVTVESVLAELKTQVQRIKHYDNKLLQEMGLQAESQETTETEEKEESEEKEAIYYAQPQIPLTPYKSHGVLNGGADGFVGFVDLFGHHIYAKNPFTALLSTGAAGISFMAFFATPLAVEWFGAAFVKFIHATGEVWTNSKVSAAMAGAFTNFKLVAAIVEGIEHGPDSWSSKALSQLLKDPAKMVTYTTLSWLIAHELIAMNIPGISEELKSHLGDPPQLAEIFGGAKLGIIAYHLISSPHKAEEGARRDYVNECLKNYVASEERRGRIVSQEKRQKMSELLSQLISREAIERLHSQVQQERTAPRLPGENKLSLMLHLAINKEKLSRLDPLLKAKINSLLPVLTRSKHDAKALVRFMDPAKYAPRSTLRSFLGRAIGYVPTILRCLLSPFSWAHTGSTYRALRPWKDLGEMLLDDVTSTTHAALRTTNKILESAFSRLPRTFADVFFNSIVARVLNLLGHFKMTQWAYKVSARWDIEQEHLAAVTTTGAMTALARENTAPHPDTSFEKVLQERTKSVFSKLPSPPPLVFPLTDPKVKLRARAQSVAVETPVPLRIRHPRGSV